jgi:hypothetical protein
VLEEISPTICAAPSTSSLTIVSIQKQDDVEFSGAFQTFYNRLTA